VEHIFRDSKLRAALRHLPSGYPEINNAWMWGALIAATMAGWFHELTGTVCRDGTMTGHGVRDGKAMIANPRHRMIHVPGQLLRHAQQLTLQLPPCHGPQRVRPVPDLDLAQRAHLGAAAV
jgi:hypothetical protein